MQKIKIRLPATITDFGPGLRSLGLALSLYTQVELIPRADDKIIVETEGEGAGYYVLGLHHPVVLGMIRVFQNLERAPLGITLRVKNEIPLNCGLGVEDAFMAAGVVGASNLLDGSLNRDDLVERVAQVSSRPDSAIASMLGGFTAVARLPDNVIYRALPLTSFKVILVIPEIENYKKPLLPKAVPVDTMLSDSQKIPIIMEALSAGNLKVLAQVLDDKLITEAIQQQITGYAHVVEMAYQAGAVGVTSSGGGPAMIFFVEKNHKEVVTALETAFENIEVSAMIQILPLDTQGIIISMLQSQS